MKTTTSSRLFATAALSAAALLVAAPAALAVGLPETFARQIVATGVKQNVRVTTFTVATRAQGTAKVRVTVRLTAAKLAGGPSGLTVAVGPCTKGAPNSPLCTPTARSTVKLHSTPVSATRTFTVGRPAKKTDALRVTLTAAGQPIPFRPENVGGGGGTAELLLNNGMWRYRQGTQWGLVSTPPATLAFDHVLFNSRRYEWRATSQVSASASTTIGYQGQQPRWTFANTMKAGIPFAFYRTPSQPVQQPRTAPSVLSYAATVDGHQLFTVLMPLSAWKPA